MSDHKSLKVFPPKNKCICNRLRHVGLFGFESCQIIGIFVQRFLLRNSRLHMNGHELFIVRRIV